MPSNSPTVKVTGYRLACANFVSGNSKILPVRREQVSSFQLLGPRGFSRRFNVRIRYA